MLSTYSASLNAFELELESGTRMNRGNEVSQSVSDSAELPGPGSCLDVVGCKGKGWTGVVPATK